MDLCNINFIKALLVKHGFRFSKSMGQNFLVAGWVPERMAEESGIDMSSGVLEIGPGVGSLTVQLCEKASRVISVELDRTLLPLLEETLSDCTNIEIISGDILKLDIKKTISEKLPGLRISACANLPYNITTPVLTALIDAGCFETITVMVQREVAKRICAEAGTRDYGAFTVYAKYYTEPEILFDVSPDCFIPQPKVYSSVINLKKRTAAHTNINDEVLFSRVVKASFAQRRKTLVNGLFAAFGDHISKEELSELVTKCGFDVRIRGETLDIEGFALIANALGERQKKNQEES